MNTFVLFALVLAIAGGLIAHFGDRLGTYVGKKRISVIGLRPRHTAMLYTICSGGIIALLTLGVLMLSDQGVHQAVLEGPRLLAENRLYQHQIKEKQQQMRVEQQRAAEATIELAAANAKFRPVKRQLKALQDQLSRSQLDLKNRQSQLASAKTQLSSIRAALGRTNANLQQANLEVSRAKRSLAVADANVRSANNRVAAEQKNVSNLQSTRKRLQAENSTLTATNADLTVQSKLLASRVTAASESLIYPKGQELDRLVIKTTQPVSTIKTKIVDFLQYLSEVAQGKGGKLGDNGRAVVIAVPLDSDNYRPLNPSDEMDAVNVLAQNIAGESAAVSSIVLVAHAANNTFVGEQTSIELSPYKNLLIYRKDAVIAKGIITDAQSTSQIIDALHAFLTDKVRPAVKSQHLILQTDASGQSIVGAVPAPTIDSLIQQITRFGGSAEVTAYASEDIYTSGPVRLRFTVAPLGPVPVAPHSPDKVRNRS